VQGFHAAEEQVRCHRFQRRAVDLAVMVDAAHQVRVAADDATQRIRVPAEKFRGAVEHQVAAEFEGVLVDRGRKGVVGHDHRTGSVAGRGEAGEVEHLQRGVGGRFQVQDPAAARGAGSLPDRRFDLLVVGGIAQRHLYAPVGQKLGEDLVRAAVGVLDRNDAVPGRQEREERVADGRHAGREAGRRGRALQHAHLLLEGLNRRIGVAAVDVARGTALGHVEPGFHVRIAVRRAENDRHLGCGARPSGVGARPFAAALWATALRASFATPHGKRRLRDIVAHAAPPAVFRASITSGAESSEPPAAGMCRRWQRFLAT